MRHGLGLHLAIQSPYSYASIEEATVLAERMGFKSVWVGDHFFLPPQSYEKFCGDPKRPDKLDAWTVLAALAIRTKRIGLGARVSPIPFYQPPRLAKMVTTVDIISGGRALLGVGAGWHRQEALSYSLPWGRLDKRIDLMLEGLDLILRLWKEERTSFEGKYYRVKDAPFFPKPLQKPYPPIYFGGHSHRILEAVAKLGDGWLPTTNMPLETFQQLASRVQAQAKEAGRDPAQIALTPSLAYPKGTGEKSDEWVDNVARFFKMGAQQVLLDLSETPARPKEGLEFLRAFGEKVAPLYKE